MGIRGSAAANQTELLGHIPDVMRNAGTLLSLTLSASLNARGIGCRQTVFIAESPMARFSRVDGLARSTIQTRSSRKARVCFTLLCGSYCCASGRAPYRATNRPSAPPKLHWLVTSHRQRQEHRLVSKDGVLVS
jgi:hypothetical protein